MSIITKPRKSNKAAKPFSCSFVSMTIEVNDTRYSVDQTDPGEFGTRSFRLCKRSGNHEIYDLVRTHAGIVECTCPDYESRHRGNGYGTCKHGKALVELGLMPAPLAPEFAPAKGVHTVNALPVVAPEFAPADRIPDAIRNAGAPTEVEPAPEPCCPESEPAPCLACVEAAPVAQCVCPTCTEDAECVAAEAEDMGHPSTWSAEADAFTWELGADARHPEPDGPDDGPADEDRDDAPEPEFDPAADWEPTFDLDDEPEDRDDWARETEARHHLDQSERLSMEELVQRQCDFYAGFGNAAGDMLAGAMTELLARIQATGATTPSEYDARVDCLDRLDLDRSYRLGFDAGVAHARSVEVGASAWGHDS